MANFDNINREIDQNVNTNGVQAITGKILNTTLKDMLQEVDDKKQDTLVAGSGISISGNTISATGGGSGQSYVAGAGIDISGDTISVDYNQAQEKLVAGQNITFNGRIINAKRVDAGNGISILRDTSTDIISVNASDLAGDGLDVDSNGKLAIDPTEVQEKLQDGDHISISGNTISATGFQEPLVSGQNLKTINGNSLLGSGDIVISGGSGGNYLPLEGGTLQNTSTGDTELKVIDGADEDYVKVVASETQGERPHIEIFENGSGDTKVYYDRIEKGSDTIMLPSQSGTLALTSDLQGKQDTLVSGQNLKTINGNSLLGSGDIVIQGGSSYQAGNGINITGNTISVDTTEVQEKLVAGQNITITGNTISATGGGGSYTAGRGIDISGNTISLSSNITDTYSPGETSAVTQQSFASPALGEAQIYISVEDNEIGSPSKSSSSYLGLLDTNGFIEITTTGITVDDNPGYKLSYPTLTQNETIATTGDLSRKQDTLTAGTGISIDSNNVISATGGGGSGLWVNGSGYNSLMSPDAVEGQGSATGRGSISAGYATNATQLYSFAGGNGSTASGESSFAYGENNAATGLGAVAIGVSNQAASYGVSMGHSNIAPANSVAIGISNMAHSASVAIGHNLNTSNNHEVALGYRNKTYSGNNQETYDDNIETLFTLGNGDGSSVKNSVEIKKNNDIYVVGVGGFDGTNSASATTLQDAINNGGSGTSYTAGNGIDITGTTISVDATDLDGSGLSVDANGALEVDTTTIQEKLTAGSNISISGSTISATDTTYSAGSGLNLNGTTFSADTTVLATQNDLSGKQDTLVSGTNIKTINGTSLLGSGDITVGGGGSSYTAGNGIGIQNDTISVLYDSTRGIGYDNSVGHNELFVQLGNGLQFDGNGAIETTGGGSSYTAGTGISIDSSNVITNTAPDPGFWVADGGTNSIKTSNAQLSSSGNYSIAIGEKASASNNNSIAIGHSAWANSNQDVIAIGFTVSAQNRGEIALGRYNKGYNYSQGDNIGTLFTIGAGTGTWQRKNAFEIKLDNSVYVYGVGSYDGTNADGSTASSLQTILNGKQDALVAGSGITISGNTISATGGGGSGSYLPLSGGTLEGASTSTSLVVQAPQSESTANITLEALGTGSSSISLTSESSIPTDVEDFEINSDGSFTLNYVSGTNDTITLPKTTGTIALQGDLAGKNNYTESAIVYSIGIGTSSNPLNALAVDSSGNIFIKGLGGYTGQSISGATSIQTLLSSSN